MTPANVLNADMATLARWATSGAQWWIDELRALVPPALQQRLRRGGDVLAQGDGHSGFIIEAGGQRRVADTAKPVAAALALPPGSFLVRQMRLPALGRSDLENMVRFNLDRLMPLAPQDALVAIETGARINGHQQVEIAIVKRRQATKLVAAARDAGVDARRLGIRDSGALRFDFIPALNAVNGTGASRAARNWWLLAGLAFAVNVGELVLRDIGSVQALRDVVDQHRVTADKARQVKARVVEENAQRRALEQARQTSSPLGMLAATTNALPDGAWVQRLTWDGTKLRLIGFKQGGVDVIAALRRMPGFVQVRGSNAEVAARQAVGEPFDVTATSAGTAQAAR